MTPSKYQKDVYDFALDGKGNASVEAVAGSGKTTTIIQVQKFLQPYERVLFSAFNKSVVNELQKKCPDFVRVSTMHSLGWRGLKNTFDLTEGQINNNKVWDWCELLFGKRQYKNRNHKYAYFANLVKICDLLRTNLGSTDTDVISLSDYHNINFIGSEVEDSIVLLNAVTCDLDQFDFTDMVYLPSIIKEIEFPKFDWIFVDEQQDLNLPQQIIIDKMKNRNTRVMGVGDRCQPAGTLVTVQTNDSLYRKGLRGSVPAKFVQKKIEDLKIGEAVLSYDKSACYFHNQEIKGISKNYYNGDLIVCEMSDGKVTKFTPNHICLASFEAFRDKVALYLMKKNNQFRIGTSLVNMNTQSTGVVKRMRDEKADCVWVLSFFDTKEEAYFYEQVFSAKFGLPQLVFSNKDVIVDVEKIWRLIGDNSDRGEKCLSFFRKDVNYPLFERSREQLSLKRPMFVRAINLFDGCKMLPFLDKKEGRKEDWKSIFLSRETYNGFVYSLSVNKYETYISDNIVTHNCQAIYGFAGADVRSFDNMSNKPNTIKLPLSICYRCAQSIVNEAKTIVPQIEWFESSPEGIVRTGEISEIANGDWVICRNTKPLVVLCLELIKTGKKAKILGKEIGKGITKILHRIGIRHKVVALKMLENEYNLMVLKYKQMGMEKPEFHPKVVAFKENTEIIRHVCDSCSDIPEAIKQIESIFDDAKTPITLSTIHKAKGLENDRVFFLRPDLIPSRFAVHAWQLEQEQNLKYVAITRAKKELVKVFNFDYDKR